MLTETNAVRIHVRTVLITFFFEVASLDLAASKHFQKFLSQRHIAYRCAHPRTSTTHYDNKKALVLSSQFWLFAA